MEIKVGKLSGFCYGSRRAVDGALQAVQDASGPIYCYGKLLHNASVIRHLEEQEIIFIDDLKDAKGPTIIRAHGVAKQVYEDAKKRGIPLLDFSCPSVLKIHHIVEDAVRDGYYIFLLGEKSHPEVIGTESFCGENYALLSSMDDVEPALQAYASSRLQRLLVIAQTTFSLDEFERIVQKIKEKVTGELVVKNTICMATENRQKECAELSKEVEAMIIIGGKESANTNKLYEIAKKGCAHTYFISDASELNLEEMKSYQFIGIMGGASTPQESINQLIFLLNQCD